MGSRFLCTHTVLTQTVTVGIWELSTHMVTTREFRQKMPCHLPCASAPLPHGGAPRFQVLAISAGTFFRCLSFQSSRAVAAASKRCAIGGAARRPAA
jgi:hypothetical protein